MTSPRLEPCPFCGGEAHFHEVIDGDREGAWYIDCKECSASTCLALPLKDDCKPYLAEQWNRRAGARPSLTSPALKEIVERMRAECHKVRLARTDGSKMFTHASTIESWADEIERAASLTARQKDAIEHGIDAIESWSGMESGSSSAQAERAENVAVLRALLEGPTQEPICECGHTRREHIGCTLFIPRREGSTQEASDGR